MNNGGGYREIFSLKDKVALVTGGASHLGAAMSNALRDFGAKVILLSRNEQRLKDFIDQNSGAGDNCLEYYVCDVTREDDIHAVVEKVLARHGSVDILVNNAYSGTREKWEELTKASWDDAIENCLTLYYLTIKAVSPAMLKAGRGSIINMASLWSMLAPDQRVYLDLNNNAPLHYAVSKGGVLQMTRYLAALWAEKGIRVNAISPGWFPKKKGPERPDYMREITGRIPMDRIGHPDDLAGIAIFLASGASSYITGQNIVIDGGYSIW
ncbi:MAG: SDR family oxidoreductase [Nitrospiraceae bacterium]|nr:MAG: SDR family oxidoreductase [Nitrospiraceae bacterium]